MGNTSGCPWLPCLPGPLVRPSLRDTGKCGPGHPLVCYKPVRGRPFPGRRRLPPQPVPARLPPWAAHWVLPPAAPAAPGLLPLHLPLFRLPGLPSNSPTPSASSNPPLSLRLLRFPQVGATDPAGLAGFGAGLTLAGQLGPAGPASFHGPFLAGVRPATSASVWRYKSPSCSSSMHGGVQQWSAQVVAPGVPS